MKGKGSPKGNQFKWKAKCKGNFGERDLGFNHES